MRTIKFRAWDKRGYRSMQEVTCIHFDKHGLPEYVDFKTPMLLDLQQERLSDGNLELLQFTGLLDKNGKKIYEGDILSDGEIKWDVDWVQEAEGLEDGKKWGYAPNITGFRTPFDLKKFEIIGNIYENPELITNPHA